MSAEIFHRCPSCGFTFSNVDGRAIPDPVVIIREVEAARPRRLAPVFNSACKHPGCEFFSTDGEAFNAHMREHDAKLQYDREQAAQLEAARTQEQSTANESIESKLARAKGELKAVADAIDLRHVLADLEDAKRVLASFEPTRGDGPITE